VMLKILPSLASANQMKLGEEIARIRDFKHLHFDIEDGNFVANITFGLKTIKSAMAQCGAIICDAHLMVTKPEDYIDELIALGFKAIAVHWEGLAYPMKLINKVKQQGVRVGLALNPRTAITEIVSYLPDIDYVLLMASEPDNEGELFQYRIYEKIEQLRQVDKEITVVVDGGIKPEMLRGLEAGGVNEVVLGRCLFQGDDISVFDSYLDKEVFK